MNSPTSMCLIVASDIAARSPARNPFSSADQMRCGVGRKTGDTSRISATMAIMTTRSTARPKLRQLPQEAFPPRHAAVPKSCARPASSSAFNDQPRSPIHSSRANIRSGCSDCCATVMA